MSENKENKQNDQVKEAKEFLLNALSNAIHNGKQTFLCANCAHKEVCSKIQEPGDKCEHFSDATLPQRYSSIHHFFNPFLTGLKFITLLEK